MSAISRETRLSLWGRAVTFENVWKSMKMSKSLAEMRGPLIQATHFFRELRVSGHKFLEKYVTFSQPMSAISRETRLSLWGRAATFENVWKSMNMLKSLAEMRGPLIQATHFFTRITRVRSQIYREIRTFSQPMSATSRETRLSLWGRAVTFENVWKSMKMLKSIAKMRGS